MTGENGEFYDCMKCGRTFCKSCHPPKYLSNEVVFERNYRGMIVYCISRRDTKFCDKCQKILKVKSGEGL